MEITLPHISEIKKLTFEQQQEFYKSLTPEQLLQFKYDWKSHARPNQVLPEEGWRQALILAGRGWGKTRTGAEWIRECVEKYGCTRIGLIGPTSYDLRDVMFNGLSGIGNISPHWNKPRLIQSRAEIVWPNGAKAKLISAEEPEALRGPQYHAIWWDEPARCKKAQEVYDGLKFALRLTTHKGVPPRLIMTTTPKPIPIIKKFVERVESGDNGLIIVRGSTSENKENMDKEAIDDLYSEFGGTRLGRQELEAEILMDNEGSLWTSDSLDLAKKGFITEDSIYEYVEKMRRVVVGVDPSGSDGSSGDETGIVIAGKDDDGLYYVLGDFTLRGSPETWGQKVVDVCREYQVDKIIVEKNNGGDMVRSVIHNIWQDAPIKKIHAKVNKSVRAQPVSMLYEQGKVKHINDYIELEEQMLNMIEAKPYYVGKDSPDRVDALVYAIMDLRNSNKMSFEGVTIKGRHH